MKDRFEAAIVDLDGVITQTAFQHARAWKEMFDQYNERRKKNGQPVFRHFSIKEDYAKYVDGIPRYDGVRAFLHSQNINIPFGNSEDEPGKETVCGLGNRKNDIFLKIIEKEGVSIFEKNVDAIRNWKEKKGMKTAIISSSKNCKHILHAANLEFLFDTRVDGIVSKERNIKGKPDPAIFLEAAKELKVDPQNTIVVEDALAGVEAAKRGDFGLVIGIRNHAGKDDLLNKGADKVVDSLDELEFLDQYERDPSRLPSALKEFPKLTGRFEKKELILFLDFDGTLSPIVEEHGEAKLTPGMKQILEEIAKKFNIAVISGRDLNDVQQKVGIKNIYYAGSHGFEISGPHNFQWENKDVQKTLPVLDKMNSTIQKKTDHIKGVRLEHKKYSIAVHYRQVNDREQSEIVNITKEVALEFEGIKIREGKKVIELQSDVDWDKGNAVEVLLSKMSSDSKNISPVYLGDDLTDEDAFAALPSGVKILVGGHGAKTRADYHLNNTTEVKEFLQKLLNLSVSL